MKTIILPLVLAAALAACGSKSKKTATTPDKDSTEMKSGGMGGATYGSGHAGSAAPMSGADPCAAK